MGDVWSNLSSNPLQKAKCFVTFIYRTSRFTRLFDIFIAAQSRFSLRERVGDVERYSYGEPHEEHVRATGTNQYMSLSGIPGAVVSDAPKSFHSIPSHVTVRVQTWTMSLMPLRRSRGPSVVVPV